MPVPYIGLFLPLLGTLSQGRANLDLKILFPLFSALFHKNEYFQEFFSFKMFFLNSQIGPPYYTLGL
jgi:hypothetical protein